MKLCSSDNHYIKYFKSFMYNVKLLENNEGGGDNEILENSTMTALLEYLNNLP